MPCPDAAAAPKPYYHGPPRAGFLLSGVNMQTKEIIEDIPCGQSVTIQHFDEDGNLVSQDVEIRVTKLEPIGAETGEL
jgi:hypothetical protein